MMPTITNSDHLRAVEWAATILRETCNGAFYGMIEVEIKAGRIQSVAKRQTFKPPSQENT